MPPGTGVHSGWRAQNRYTEHRRRGDRAPRISASMRHIIHDWSDEESVQILHNCRQRVSDDGRVLIVEAIVPEGNDPSPAKAMDMAMLLYPGGMERTEMEYQALLNSAGFEFAGVTPTTSMVSVVEGRPAA